MQVGLTWHRGRLQRAEEVAQQPFHTRPAHPVLHSRSEVNPIAPRAAHGPPHLVPGARSSSQDGMGWAADSGSGTRPAFRTLRLGVRGSNHGACQAKGRWPERPAAVRRDRTRGSSTEASVQAAPRLRGQSERPLACSPVARDAPSRTDRCEPWRSRTLGEGEGDSADLTCRRRRRPDLPRARTVHERERGALQEGDTMLCKRETDS